MQIEKYQLISKSHEESKGSEAQGAPQLPMNPCSKSKTNLFVNGIGVNVDEGKLREFFSKCG